jgi:hypothetical protein
MRKPLSHSAYVRKLNRQMRRHPHYQSGMRVIRIHGGLYEIAPPEHLDAKDPRAMQEFRADPGLQRVLWDSVSVLQKRYYYISEYMRSKMLPRNLFFRMSREGCRSVLLQNRLRSLHRALVTYKRDEGSWPPDAAPLIRAHHLMDPWRAGQFLQVAYRVPGVTEGGSGAAEVLAEYVREGRRKFVLYADGHQETWRL